MEAPDESSAVVIGLHSRRSGADNFSHLPLPDGGQSAVRETDLSAVAALVERFGAGLGTGAGTRRVPSPRASGPAAVCRERPGRDRGPGACTGGWMSFGQELARRAGAGSTRLEFLSG